jgi:hypothetical protein
VAAELLAADLLGAAGHPGGAAHLLLLAVVALVALVVFAVSRVNKRRTRRDAVQSEQQAAARELSPRHRQPADQIREPAQETDATPRDEILGG